ncbi:hypothetical protein [Sphingopyxis panaciterrulae]|uniref:Uncharacterized protein n=1 Tax=Sphingopyxis panaciterrulae TaxID=462372 RepID=A0A7W9ESI0_9SPHN|nr:hypothetical protein [Sphingopyxis panaciterrulae]MBB5708749.1 hypothetical protein [Sphingopyxis panaciterrulae]
MRGALRPGNERPLILSGIVGIATAFIARMLDLNDETATCVGPGTDRHLALAACKWRLSALPVLTYHEHAARRVAKTHHFRLAIF